MKKVKGKSALVKKWAKKQGVPCMDLKLPKIRFEDLRGLPKSTKFVGAVRTGQPTP